MLMVVRHYDLMHTARANLATSDDDWNIDSLGGDRTSGDPSARLAPENRAGIQGFGSLTGGGTRVTPAIPAKEHRRRATQW
jgi:hypothetical protein